jgi:putative membrane protein
LVDRGEDRIAGSFGGALWNNAAFDPFNMTENPNRARDHLANERTFLAWVRTGIAVVVFGFAIGRFAIALRQLAQFQGHSLRTAGISVWMGMISILAGVVMLVAGLMRYRKARVQIDAGTFEPAGFVVNVIAVLTVLFALALAVYLIYTAKSLG